MTHITYPLAIVMQLRYRHMRRRYFEKIARKFTTRSKARNLSRFVP